MLFPHVTKLYIYKPPNDFTLNILRSDRLWSAKPEHFNDPFDCDLEIAEFITEESLMTTVRVMHGERADWPPAITQFVDSILDPYGNFTAAERTRLDTETANLIQENRDSGIVCLSEVPDSILMWSHYAQNHAGVCFEFTRVDGNALGDAGICSPVKYGAHYPQIDLGRMLLNRDGQTMDLMMRYKASAWTYEREWRIITDHGDMECPLPGPIARVILGIRVSGPFKSDIEALCNAKGIPCVQATKADREFRIEIPA
jgi:hypothetical protein